MSPQKEPSIQKEYSLEAKTQRMRYRFLAIWALIGFGVVFMGLGIVMDILAVPVGIAIWTTVIVFILRTPINALERRGIKRGAGTAIAYAGMCCALALLVWLALTPVFGIGEQFQNLVDNAPTYVSQISAAGNDFYNQHSNIFQNEDIQKYFNDATDAVQSALSDIARNSAAGLVGLGTSLVNCCIVIGFALVIAFWILMDLPALGRECKRIAGEKYAEEANMFYATFTNVVDGYIRGTLIQIIIIAAGCTILYGIMGIPNFIALGFITGLLNILPVIGPWLGAFAAFLAAILIDPLLALVAVILVSCIQQFVYTFIGPKIMSSSVDVHPAAVLMALMLGSSIGMAMSGMIGSLVGMLVSIPAIALAKAVFVYFFEKRTGRQLVSPDGALFKGVPKQVGTVDPTADASAPHPKTVAATEIRERVRKRLKNKNNGKS